MPNSNVESSVVKPILDATKLRLPKEGSLHLLARAHLCGKRNPTTHVLPLMVCFLSRCFPCWDRVIVTLDCVLRIARV